MATKFTLGSKPLEETKKARPALPKATVTTDLLNEDGNDIIRVTVDYPVPDDEQIEETVRMGRNTLKDDPDNPGQKIGQDNSTKVASILKILGAARKVDLVYSVPNDPNDLSKGVTEVLLTDGQEPNANTLRFTGIISVRIKGEGADDDEGEGTED